MKKSPHRYQLGKVFALMAIAISVFGVSGSAFAAYIAYDSYSTPKEVGNDISIADWNSIGEALNGISYNESSSVASWGFGTAADETSTYTISTANGLSVAGLTSLDGGLTIETGDTLTYGGQALTTISTGVADNGALVTQGYVDDQISTNSGPFAITGTVISNENGTYASDDFVFGSPQFADDGDTDHDARMWFDKSKGAFRVGSATSSYYWDDSNVGSGSIAMGTNSRASGLNAIAIGPYSDAGGIHALTIGATSSSGGDYSTAIGQASNASGNHAVALGWNTTSSGTISLAMGYYTTAHDRGEMTIGQYNIVGTGNQSSWVSTDNLFVIGNGTDTGSRSNALTILKSGKTTINAPADEALLTAQPTGGDDLAIATTGYVDSATVSTDQISGNAVTCAAAGDVGNVGYVAAVDGVSPGYFEGCIETITAGVYDVVRLSIFEQ